MERSDKQRVLVVDDDREIVAAIVRLLEREGIEAIPAYNGREAVERLTENEIHLIIIDIMMPEMDGISATIKIRTERNIPVIMLSAKTEESDKILGLSVGADDYVTKPFSPAELIARVKSQLRRYMTLGDYANRSGGSDVALGGLLLPRRSRQKPEQDPQRSERSLNIVLSVAAGILCAASLALSLFGERDTAALLLVPPTAAALRQTLWFMKSAGAEHPATQREKLAERISCGKYKL